jgi:hypothetical protein
MTCFVSLASGKRAKPVRAQPTSAARNPIARVTSSGDPISMFTLFIAPRLPAGETRGEMRASSHLRCCRASDKLRQDRADRKCRFMSPFQRGRVVTSRSKHAFCVPMVLWDGRLHLYGRCFGSDIRVPEMRESISTYPPQSSPVSKPPRAHTT